MFISSYEKLRRKVLNNGTIINMIHSGAATFSDLSSFNVLSTAFCWKKENLKIDSCFVRLADYYNYNDKMKNFKNKKNYYYLNQNTFFEIKGIPFVYWISDNLKKAFIENKTLGDYYDARQGLATGNNNEFIKFWYEVPINEIGLNCGSLEELHKSGKKYALYNKGGIYRKWYGNYDYVIKFDKKNYEILSKQGNHLPSRQYYFKPGITWSLFGFENFGVRYKNKGYVFDVSGSSMFPDEDNLYYVIGYLCSSTAFKFLSIIAPTVNFQVGNIASLPYKNIDNNNELVKYKEKINKLVKENIKICKEEWSYYETSIEFKVHPLLLKKIKSEKLSDSLEKFEKHYNSLRNKLRKNEEELNKIYAKIFNVEKDVQYKVNDRDLTIKPFNKEEFIESFLSYIIGVLLGRYSYENNCIKSKKEIDLNNITKDIISFLEGVYGNKYEEENINYISSIISKNPKNIYNVIDKYFEKEFYNNHLKQYQKRPIYIQNGSKLYLNKIN
jgi:hypothetical protein